MLEDRWFSILRYEYRQQRTRDLLVEDELSYLYVGG